MRGCEQVFLFWAYYSSAQNTRRIKMIRLRTRFDMRQLQRAFVQLNESALVRRRRRQMLAKTAAAVQRSKVSNAAARLLEHSKTCLRRRRVFQMLLKRHQSKLIQHAWGEWEMRMEVWLQLVSRAAPALHLFLLCLLQHFACTCCAC
jgi:hypothetical protein